MEPQRQKGLGLYLFMEDPLPGGLRGPATRSWLGAVWGPLPPAGMSRSPLVLPLTDDISVLLGPPAHTPAAPVVPSMEPRACGIETRLASWWVFHTHFSEASVDGPVQSVARAVLTLSASSLGLLASVVVSLPFSLAPALFVAELLVPHSQSRSAVWGIPPTAEAGLSEIGMVAQMELSTWLTVPAATHPGVPGFCIPLAEAVLLLVSGVRATLSHAGPCLSVVWVVLRAHLLAAGEAVPKDLLMSSPAADVALGLGLGLGEPVGRAEGNMGRLLRPTGFI